MPATRETAGRLLLVPSFLSACPSLSQTKDALLKILEDVKEDDYLNFILFSGDVTTWKDTLVQATPENIEEARTFVKNIDDQGSMSGGKNRHILSLPLARAVCLSCALGQSLCWSRPCRPQLGGRGGIGGSSGFLLGCLLCSLGEPTLPFSNP